MQPTAAQSGGPGLLWSEEIARTRAELRNLTADKEVAVEGEQAQIFPVTTDLSRIIIQHADAVVDVDPTLTQTNAEELLGRLQGELEKLMDQGELAEDLVVRRLRETPRTGGED